MSEKSEIINLTNISHNADTNHKRENPNPARMVKGWFSNYQRQQDS